MVIGESLPKILYDALPIVSTHQVHISCASFLTVELFLVIRELLGD